MMTETIRIKFFLGKRRVSKMGIIAAIQANKPI
jgi:hypothetical protein